MTDHWTDRLSEYVDGDLSPNERRALEAHLSGCPTCAGVVADLRAVVATASELTDRDPAVDLWPGIAAQLPSAPGVTSLSRRQRLHQRRVTFSVPQLAAAGLALVLVSSGLLWAALRDRGGDVSPVELPAMAVAAAAADPATAYGAAIADLEALLAQHRESLDTATVRVLEESLTIIDRAIAEAQAALAEDPANRYLNGHLTTTMQRKLTLLQQAVSLTTVAS
jgi:anti-sigma factor RsiW